jgi:hypothetical protein
MEGRNMNEQFTHYEQMPDSLERMLCGIRHQAHRLLAKHYESETLDPSNLDYYSGDLGHTWICAVKAIYSGLEALDKEIQDVWIMDPEDEPSWIANRYRRAQEQKLAFLNWARATLYPTR